MTASAEFAPIVQLRGVTKRFGSRVAVDALDLEIPAGGCFGLLGPNGAGKTTALRLIYGATRPSAGSLRVFGLDLAIEARAVRARLGVTLQENALIESLSARDNLRIFARYHCLREPALSRRVDELIARLELQSHADEPTAQLSGGFQRRVAVAMSLLNDPELWILDEPTTGLDPAVRLALWKRVRDVVARGTTVLLTTHYMDEAERLCDRVAIMSQGRILAQGSPSELISAHLHAHAAEIDCGEADEARITAGFGAPLARLRAGGRLLLFADDARALALHLEARAGAALRPRAIRAANLEDVFLAVTGTRLEESV
jgi:lipooligosaccharide transport system ATP-binding protein